MDAIAAYESLAAHYSNISASRSRYLQAVEQIIVAHGHGAASLLDIGAGNAVRTLRIAAAANIPRVVALEPSAEMRKQIPATLEVWGCKATEVPESAGPFALITCLWNVLGILTGTEERILMLTRARQLLASGGTMFLDVNHRYNAGAYGWNATLWRMVRDHMSWSDRNGDVIASWELDGHRVQARGHVFIQKELEDLFQQAGLAIRKRWILDYENGALRKSAFQGNLLYALAAEDRYI